MKRQLAKKIDKFKLGGTPNLNTVYINNLTKMLNNAVGNNQLSQAEYGMDMQFGDPTKPKKPQVTKPVQPYYTSDRKDYDYHVKEHADSMKLYLENAKWQPSRDAEIKKAVDWAINKNTIKKENVNKIITDNKSKTIKIPTTSYIPLQNDKTLTEANVWNKVNKKIKPTNVGRVYASDKNGNVLVDKNKTPFIFEYPVYKKPVQEVIFRANNNTIKKTLTPIPTKVKYANKKKTITNSNVVPEDKIIPQDEITPLDPMSFPQVARPEQQIIPAPPYVKPVHYAGPRYGTQAGDENLNLEDDATQEQIAAARRDKSATDFQQKNLEYQEQEKAKITKRLQPAVLTEKFRQGGEPFNLNTKYINNLTNILNNVAGNNQLSQAAYGMNMEPGGPDKPVKPNNITTQDTDISLEDYLKLYENSLALEKGITSTPNYELEGSSNNVDDYLEQLAQAREYWADSPKELEQLQSQLKSNSLNQSDQQRKYAELSVARKIETNNINDYYTVVSPNSFYQRDISNGFVNKNFPRAYYDSRVKPSSRNNYSYQSSDENDNFFDNIQVYKYDPVEVKKQALLKYADSEEAFQNILNNSTGNAATSLKSNQIIQETPPNKVASEQITIPVQNAVQKTMRLPVQGVEDYWIKDPVLGNIKKQRPVTTYKEVPWTDESAGSQNYNINTGTINTNVSQDNKKHLKPAVLTENFKEGGEPDKTLPDEEWYKKYQQQKAKYESDKAKGIISSTGYQDEVTVTPANNNRQKGIQVTPEQYKELERKSKGQKWAKQFGEQYSTYESQPWNHTPQSAGSADWFWTLPFAAPAAIEAAGAIGAMSLPFMSTIPGATVGNAAMAAGMANSFYKAPQNVKDWYDVSQGTKDWKEAAAGTGEIALGLLGSKAGFKSVADDVAQGAKTVSNITKKAKDYITPFQSEINWGNWNKEILADKPLLKEYSKIEKTAKTDGTWMKNSDGSAYKGTPEQFVQENSQAWKNAFPEGADKTYRGSQFLTPTFKTTAFKDKDIITFGTSNESVAKHYATSHPVNWTRKFQDVGKDVPYWHPDKNIEKLYEGNPANAEPGMYELMYPKGQQTIVAEGNAKSWAEIKNDEVADWLNKTKPNNKNNRIGSSLDPNLVKTDDVASYMINKGVPVGKANNVYDGPDFNFNDVTADVTMLNTSKIPVKSRWYNNGKFDMTNPNIYKAAIPLTIGTGAALNQWHLQPATIEGGFKNGGDVESWVDDLDDEQIKAYRKAGYIVKVIK